MGSNLDKHDERKQNKKTKEGAKIPVMTIGVLDAVTDTEL
jgi:hypothetical protein